MLWLIAIGKGAAITVPVAPAPGKKPGEWRTYNSTINPSEVSYETQGIKWGDPVIINLSGKSGDPASATLIGKGEDLKGFSNITVYVKGRGKIKLNLYYTYDGEYMMIAKEVNANSEWEEIVFKLSEGLEFGLGMPNRPDVIMPYKLVISSENNAVIHFGGVYIRR